MLHLSHQLSQVCRSLDIEAPTKVDRDKFAKAFARFLGIPLYSDENGSIPKDDTTPPWIGMLFQRSAAQICR
jgi:hypothetical protein